MDARGVFETSPTLASNGNFRNMRVSNTGQLFSADWITDLVLEGRVFHMTVGTITGGGDVSLITGGGAGTTIDQDQPEFGVSVPAGTDLIPIAIKIGCQVDLDADGEEGNIVVAYDSGAAYAGDGTATSETPINALGDAGVTSVATAFSAATGDITDPTVDGILAYKTVQASHAGTAASQNAVSLDLDWEARFPFILRGPSAFYGYWGGTAAVVGIASVMWAEVPSGRYNVIQ